MTKRGWGFVGDEESVRKLLPSLGGRFWDVIWGTGKGGEQMVERNVYNEDYICLGYGLLLGRWWRNII